MPTKRRMGYSVRPLNGKRRHVVVVNAQDAKLVATLGKISDPANQHVFDLAAALDDFADVDAE